MADYIQIKNPKTGLYVKIDREIGSIVSHKKTKGPYKNIPIKRKEEKMEELEPIDTFKDAEEGWEAEYGGSEEFEEELEVSDDKRVYMDDVSITIIELPTKTFFDFTYPCEHGGNDHCIECYNKARKG